MDHDKAMGIADASAVAEAICSSIAPRECGIMRGVSDIAAANAPSHTGAQCPTVRLSSARPMFNGRVGAGVRDDILPRQDFTSIPPKPPPCSGKGEQDMARKSNRFDEVRRYVAGVDLAGNADHYVCGPRKDDGTHDIGHFGTTTNELLRMAAWMKERKVESAAMESTSVYWIPVYDTLESAGIEVVLVDTRTVKMVPGRKSDVKDCQWLQRLHSCGLLRGAFRPPEAFNAVRSVIREKGNVLQMRTQAIQSIQKALDMMHDVEKNAPQQIKDIVKRLYARGGSRVDADTLMNEYGAWLTMEKGGAALEKALPKAERASTARSPSCCNDKSFRKGRTTETRKYGTIQAHEECRGRSGWLADMQ